MRHKPDLLVALLALCLPVGAAAAADEPLLPVARAGHPGAGSVTFMPAVSDELKVERGCVRTSEFTLLWPEGATLGRDDAGYYVLSPQRRRLYRVGRMISFGGLNYVHDAAKHYPEVAARCTGPLVYTVVD